MADLKIDLERLETLQADMRVVRQEFDGAEEFSQAVADLVGHDRLAGVVRDFASKWNLRRSELLEELEYLAEAAKTIHDTMIELDTELSSLLTHSQGASPSPNHSQGDGNPQGGGNSQGGSGSPDATHSQGGSGSPDATHSQGTFVGMQGTHSQGTAPVGPLLLGRPGMEATFVRDPSLEEFRSMQDTAPVDGISQGTPGMQATFTQDPSLKDIPPMEAISLKVNLPVQSQGASIDGGE